MNVQLFTPYPKQKEFLNNYAESKHLFGVVSAPRGSGKTLLGMNILLYWLLKNPKAKAGWIAPTHSQSRSVFEQIVGQAHKLVSASNRMEGKLTLKNGATIKFMSSDSADNIRGFRFEYLILDEFAFMKENVINSVILPTLNPNGRKCLMISTPKGKNHFFNWFIKDESFAMKMPLTECPYVKQELIDEARKSLPVDIFRQEYEAAFVDSGNEVFTGVEKVSMVKQYDSPKNQQVYIGVDTGLASDYSVLTIMDKVGRVLGIHRFNNDSIQNIAGKFDRALKGYSVIGGNVECNGIGQGMYDLLKPKHGKIQKWFTSQKSKEEMVRKLIGDIETLTVELPTADLCPELHHEFTTYISKQSSTGKLSFTHLPGTHDDVIDSLMLANIARNQFIKKKMTVTGIRR